MLSIKIAVSGSLLRMRRVASNPLIPGSAQSITISRGCNCAASLTASAPSLASPTTSMSGASSRMRRKPRRTKLWSSTSKTEILLDMLFHWNLQTNEGSTLRWLEKFDGSAQQLRALAHGDQSNAGPCGSLDKSYAVIFNLQLQSLRQ